MISSLKNKKGQINIPEFYKDVLKIKQKERRKGRNTERKKATKERKKEERKKEERKG